MNLLLIRKWKFPDSIIGVLSIDTLFECFTLEDIERETKVPGKTAIPRGIYTVTIDYSNRFRCQMPHVLSVPGFDGIRIHSGNTAEDTEGCILIGCSKGQGTISQSRVAFNRLMAKLQKAHDLGEKIILEITGEKQEE